jgi:predicted phage terminase large subunit-like protein
MPQVEKKSSCEKLVRHNFKSFLLKVFQTTNPRTRFIDNWHIDLLLEYLYLVEIGKIKRLLVNIPPRALKSTIVSVAWPAWLLGQDPTRRIIVASYSQALSNKHSLECKLIINTKWYRRQFPHTRIEKGKNEKAKFITTKQGFRFATSIGGTLTGEGANFLIIDDPHTPLQAASSSQRKRAINWYEQTFSTRLNDKKKGVIVVLMQRLNQEDLSGYLLKNTLWQHLKLPAIAGSDMQYNCGEFYYCMQKGELLSPKREGKKELQNAKIELGSYGFNAQYLQEPIPLSSGIIKYHWLQRFDHIPDDDKLNYQSWDCASKANEYNDYSVCTTWSVSKNKYYLIDVYRARIEFPDLKSKARQLYNAYQPAAILIEDKASGQPLIQELLDNGNFPIIPISPRKDKHTRVLSILAMFEAKKIYFPHSAIWLSELEAELFTFPHAAHDDQVDALTQFLQWIKNQHADREIIRKI